MPGERTPRKVPMMPLQDIGALSWSDSNHSSRKSAALMVISLSSSAPRSEPRPAKRRPMPSSATASRTLSEPGVGAGSSMIGLAKRASLTIDLPKAG